MPETISSAGLVQLWQSALPRLAESVGHAACDSFLRSAEVLEFDGETFLLGVANEFARDWLREKHLPAISSPPTVHTAPAKPLATGFSSIPLNPKYSFENFVVADCNRFAHAAAQQVSRSPGKSYNPLFIHSKVGLGKTHLLQAIGHAAVEHNPNLQVVYISAESF